MKTINHSVCVAVLAAAHTVFFQAQPCMAGTALAIHTNRSHVCRTAHDINGRQSLLSRQAVELRVGLLIPTAGSLESEGVDVRRGAELAVSDANSTGREHASLLVRADNDPWGAGTQNMVQLAFNDHVCGLIGGLDSSSAHLIEQVAVKSNVVFVTLDSTDPTVTTAGVPWAFRIAPQERRTATPISSEFRLRFHRRYGSAPTLLAALAYDAASVILQSAQGGVDIRRQQNAIARGRFTGVTGEITFDRHGNRKS